MVLPNIWRSNCSFLQHMQETFGACRNAPWSLILLFPPLDGLVVWPPKTTLFRPPQRRPRPTIPPARVVRGGRGVRRRPKGLDPF